jgi:hypothetical protein
VSLTGSSPVTVTRRSSGTVAGVPGAVVHDTGLALATRCGINSYNVWFAE